MSCQWHFRKCVKDNLKEINEHKTETFRTMANEICFASTVSQYNRISVTMKHICKRNNLANWWNWWDTRRYHTIPAFQGFNLPGLNLAEAGNAMIKCRKPMSLAVAAWHDMIMMIMQDRDYHALLNQSAKATGKGMNLKQWEEHQHQSQN